jgi:hypothetical protein
MTSRASYPLVRALSWSLLVLVALAPVGCASRPVRLPANASVGTQHPAAWPTPRIAPPSAPAEIQAMHFSSLNVPLGSDWSGEFVASSNTASIEVATNLFTFSVPRPRIGDFRFRFHLLDVPPFYVRAYPLRVIARNAAGTETVQVVPFRISGRM